MIIISLISYLQSHCHPDVLQTNLIHKFFTIFLSVITCTFTTAPPQVSLNDVLSANTLIHQEISIKELPFSAFNIFDAEHITHILKIFPNLYLLKGKDDFSFHQKNETELLVYLRQLFQDNPEKKEINFTIKNISFTIEKITDNEKTFYFYSIKTSDQNVKVRIDFTSFDALICGLIKQPTDKPVNAPPCCKTSTSCFYLKEEKDEEDDEKKD